MKKKGSVVQLDRISDFGSEGWGFESSLGHLFVFFFVIINLEAQTIVSEIELPISVYETSGLEIINNNLITSIIGSLFFGFFIAKRLIYSREKIIFSGFFSCFTSFSGFIYFLYKIIDQGDWMQFIIYFNFIIILNLFSMYFGFWISRKFT